MSTNSDKATGAKRTLIGTMRGILEAFGGLFSLFFGTLYVFAEASKGSWIGALLVVVFYSFGVFVGIRQLWSPEAFEYSYAKFAIVLFYIVLMLCGTFALAAFVIESRGWGEFSATNKKHIFFDYLFYFYWLFLDLLPGLEITKTLELKPPVESRGRVAGLLVISFRAVVLIGLLGALKTWWEREAKAPARVDRNISPKDPVSIPPDLAGPDEAS